MPLEQNYLSPVISAKLFLTDDDDEPEGEPLDFTAWARKLRKPFLESVVVELKSNVSNTIQVQLAPPFEAWVKLTNENREYFAPGAKLVVELGYSGKAGKKEFSGTLATVSADVAAGFVSMSLEARGASYSASKVQDIVIDNDKDILQVLQRIAADRGWSIKFYDSKQGLVTTPSTSDYADLFEPIKNVVNGNVYSIVRQLLENHAGYAFYFEGSNLIILNPEIVGLSPVMPVFEYRGNIDLEAGIYPLISNIQTAYKAGSHLLINADFDADEKGEPKTEEVSRADPETRIVNTKRAGVPETVEENDGVVKKALGPIARGRNLALSSRDPNVRKKMAALKRRSEQHGGIQATFETMGNPEPWQMIDVRGLPDLFNGKYFVKSVKHQGDGSGFVTTLEGFTYGFADEESAAVTESPGKQAPSEVTPDEKRSDEETKTAE